MEHQIKPYGIVLSDETLQEHLLTLEVKHIHLNIQGVEGAKIERTKMMLLVVYNTIEAQNIELASMASSFLPLHIESAKVSYSIINPFIVTGDAKGAFGVAHAEFSLQKQTLHVVVRPSKLMLQKYKTTLRELKKTQEGEYIYDVTL